MEPLYSYSSLTLRQQYSDDLRLVAFHKHHLKHQKKKHHLPRPMIHTSSSGFIQDYFYRPEQKTTQNASVQQKNQLCQKRYPIISNRHQVQVRIVRRQIDWSVLQEENHRPRFPKWERKMVTKIAEGGNYQKLVKLLN